MDCIVKNQRRVAVYCRVYNDSEAANGRKVMEDYYTAKVRDNPEWTLVHVFTDERRRGQNRHVCQQPKGLPADDPPVPAGQNRPDPHQIPLPLRPEHAGHRQIHP